MGHIFSPESDITEVWDKFIDLLLSLLVGINTVFLEQLNVILQTLIYGPNIKHSVIR